MSSAQDEWLWPARRRLARQVKIDLIFNLPVGQVVEELWSGKAHHPEHAEGQEDDLEQHQGIPRGPAVRFCERDEASAESLVGTVAIPDQLAGKTEIHCRQST